MCFNHHVCKLNPETMDFIEDKSVPCLHVWESCICKAICLLETC